MRMGKKVAIIMVVLIAATALNAAFWFRHDIMAAYRAWRHGPLPKAVSYQTTGADQAARDALQAQIAAQATAGAPSPATKGGGATASGAPSGNANVSADTASGTAQGSAVELQKKKDAEISALAKMRSQIGDAYNLAVPFTPQAPFAVWDTLHDAACEEASAVMVKAFIDGETSLPPQTAENRILDITAYEDKTFGQDLDTTAAQTAAFMRDFMGLKNAKAVPISSMDDVKAYVSTGVPVIVPAYGRALGNPYYRSPGPVYHMLVVKGFKGNLIIVNDPGTKHGENYVYDSATLWNAVHDWNGGDVQHGAKVMIVPE